MSTTVRERLLVDLPKDEDFRYVYDEEFQNTYISTQIKVLREARGLTQTALARAAKTGQSQISEMEGDYESWSLRTLRKLARALGVRLFVTFESWGELIPKVEGFRREDLNRPEIDDDPVFDRSSVVVSQTHAQPWVAAAATTERTFVATTVVIKGPSQVTRASATSRRLLAMQTAPTGQSWEVTSNASHPH